MNELFPTVPDTTESEPTTQYLHSLIQSVSHELRGTFGVISGLHSLLPLVTEEAERNDMFNRLHNNTEYAAQLFADLEDYCAMETGTRRVELATFCLGYVLESVQKKALPALHRRKAIILMKGDSAMQVSSDEEKIRQIAKNTVFHLTCVMRVQSIEMSWEKRATNWALNIAYSGDALPQWLFTLRYEPQGSEIGRHISLLIVRRLVSVLGGAISGGTTSADGRRRISFQFPD